MSGRGLRLILRCAIVAAALSALCVPPPASAQGLLAPQSTAPVQFAPGPGSAGTSIEFPAPSGRPAAPLAQANPAVVPAGRVALMVTARYGPNSPLISGGLIWRVYTANPDANGMFRLVKEDRTATATFVLPPGDYVVDASFGLASAAKAVRLRAETVRDVLDIPAGGVRLQGRVNDVHIPPSSDQFRCLPGQSVRYRATPADRAERGDRRCRVFARGHLLRRLDLWRCELGGAFRCPGAAGQLTDVTVTHRAAVITLKLVNQHGGEALANTQWTVSTPDGDVIKELIGAFPRLVLAEATII